MRDFSFTTFLERFSFKNPKKKSDQKPESLVQAIHQKQYTPHGSRGQSVKQLTSTTVTEDERFIFEYLQKKQERQALAGVTRDESKDVDDDEFEAYLEGLGKGKKKKKADGLDDDDDDDDEFDFISDLNADVQNSKKKGNKNANAEDDADEDWASDGEAEDDDDENDAR